MKNNKKIDINADLGEYASQEAMNNEASLIQHITSASIACGGHAGDQVSMKNMIDHCIKHQVLFGPHPSYPDKNGFGRVKLRMDDESLMQSIKDQITAFMNIAMECDTKPTHIKFHGQLYNDCFTDSNLSELCLAVINAVCPDMALMCQPYSEISDIAQQSGLNVIHEAFIDRKYQSDGALVERIYEDAVISSIEDQARQAVSIACKDKVMTQNSKHIQIQADSLCIHGDHRESILTAVAVKKTLEENGCQIVGYEF